MGLNSVEPARPDATVAGPKASDRLGGMIRPGLVSITFRQLSPEQIVEASAAAGLQGIEWGGYVHVPPGDTAAAERVHTLTADAGLEVAAYGSYYRLAENDPADFAAVLDSARALGAPRIRVWCGKRGSDESDDAYRQAVVDDGRRIAELAADAGLDIVAEWHGNTLTDTAASANALLDAIGHPRFVTYWQPRRLMAGDRCLAEMDHALPRLAGLHVFEWHPETGDRLSLREGQAHWPAFLKKAIDAQGDAAAPMFALLAFVRNDDPFQMAEDAATLLRWLNDVNG